MSPFEAVAARLGGRLGALSRRAQVLLYVCVSEVLRPSYVAWLESQVRAGARAGFLERAVDAGRSFAVTGAAAADLSALIAEMERLAPETDGFVAAQDAWISGDIALRLVVGAFEPADGMWFALEPQFQATSERLFGLSDVGSESEEAGEAKALRDPGLIAAVAGLERAIDHLSSTTEPSDRDARLVREALSPLAV